MGLPPPPCCLPSLYLPGLLTWIPASYIRGFGSSSLEEADRALSCTRRRPDPTQTQFLQHCCVFWALQCHHRGLSGPIRKWLPANLTGFWVCYPEYCQIIPDHTACAAWKHIPNVKGKYYHRKSQAQMEQNTEDNSVVQGTGSFPMLHSRASLTRSHEVALSNLKIWLFP